MRTLALLAAPLPAVVVLLAVGGCGGERDVVSSCTDLPGRSVALQDSPHIAYTQADHEPFNSVPPTSGPHVPFTVATSLYDEAIPDEIQTHALEHGHVLVQYGPHVGDGDEKRLEDVARRYPRDVIVAPYSELGSGIALTAWGRIERLQRFDGARIEAFVEALSGRYNHGWSRGAEACAARPA